MSMHERAINGGFFGEGGFNRELSPVPPVSEIKEIKTQVEDQYIDTILRWSADRETSVHLDPAPIDPDEIFNPDAVGRARIELREYYNNPNIIPFMAFGHDGSPVGVASIRTRDDEFITNQEKYLTPVLERLMVDPNKRGHGIGRDLSASAINYVFNEYKGYRDEVGKTRGARKIYAWAMERGNWQINYRFFRNLGFEPKGSWERYAKNKGHKYVDDAIFFELIPSWFREAIAQKPQTAIITVNPDEGITDNAALGDEHIS